MEISADLKAAQDLASAVAKITGSGRLGSNIGQLGVITLLFVGMQSYRIIVDRRPGDIVDKSLDFIGLEQEDYERFYLDMKKNYPNLLTLVKDWNAIDDREFWDDMAKLQRDFSFTLGEQLIILNIIQFMSPFPLSSKDSLSKYI